MNKQQGLALVLVLWVVTLLTIMAGSFALTMRRETAIIMGLKNTSEARAAAEAGIAIAESMLLNEDPELRWQTNGTIYELDYHDVVIRVRLLSESGKIDINKTEQEKLLGLMQMMELEESTRLQIVDAIIDWRDNDDIALANGAEIDDYRNAGKKYGPTNRPFESIEELQLVLGMSETIFNSLEPLITVYAKGQLDINKASPEVLEALNYTNFETSGSDVSEQPIAISDNPFAIAARRAQQKAGSTNVQEAITILSEARLLDETTLKLKAVVSPSKTGAQPFQILKWENAVNNQSSLFDPNMDELVNLQYAESRYYSRPGL